MFDKYFFVCLVFPLVQNAACPDPPKGKVADISLDYYFGLDDTLRSARLMENCNPRGVHDSCQKLCGPNHACLLGKCFCVDVKPQMKDEVDDSAITTTTDKGCSKLFSRLRVLEELLRRTSKTARGRQRARSGEDSSLESESEENNPAYVQLDELGMRPTLRHHIAHFCPNLAIARSCIHQCLELGKPAFCGKDHVCYCGHKYGTPKDDVVASEEYYTQFQDLYERYFGPKPEVLKLKKITTTTTTTTLKTTFVENSLEDSSDDKDSNEEEQQGNKGENEDNNEEEQHGSKGENEDNNEEEQHGSKGENEDNNEEEQHGSKGENEDNNEEEQHGSKGENEDNNEEEQHGSKDENKEEEQQDSAGEKKNK